MNTTKQAFFRVFSNCRLILGYMIPMHVIILFTGLLPNTNITVKIRGRLLSPFFKKCGKNLQIASGVVINHPRNIEIGENVYIGHNSWISGTGGVKICDNVLIGPLCVVVSGKHIFRDGKLTNESKTSKVVIGHDTWLCAHVTVTDGVSIGDGVLVAAGSVVTRNVKTKCVVGGVPAQVIKENS